MPFNRTRMELKPINGVKAVGIKSTFNRTRMELKHAGYPHNLCIYSRPFNRTRMELKQNTFGRIYFRFTLLIVPEWN